MKKIGYVIYPSFRSMLRPICWIGLFCALLNVGGLLCVAGSPRGIDWRAFKIFIGIPWGGIFVPILLIFCSYRIAVDDEKITFYMFFLPVKTVFLKNIVRVKFNKISSNGQPCSISLDCKNEKFIYPVRLFDEITVKRFIDDVNATVSNMRGTFDGKDNVMRSSIIEAAGGRVTNRSEPK